jgi:aryl-phospho-beta-D-glucosidase BglC (GH1 family)
MCLSLLILRLGVFVGMRFVGEVSIMKLVVHKRPSGLRASRLAYFKRKRDCRLVNESLKIGINLGGWISQYKYFDPRHFDTFITKEDIRRISDWGFDHIRLPIDD